MSTAPFELTRIGRRRATDEVYDILRRGVLEHLFAPGERLNIDEIARKLGVSLTPVRGAIQQLAAEGLIEIRPRSGTFVAALSPCDISETFDIRRALECLAAETAVDRLTAAAIARLRVLVASMRKPIRSDDDLREHETANFEFHRILVEASGNRRLARIYEELKAHIQIGRVHASSRAGLKERLRAEQAEHDEILAAVMARDAARLSTALRAHIDRARNSLIAILSKA